MILYLVQLGIWSAALAERLRKLQRPEDKESDLMAVPAITVVGHAWTVYYSYTTEDGDRVSFNHRSHYARRKADGQCRCYMAWTLATVAGIYSIMKIIQIIAEYEVETYLPWLERCILD
jgi:hypothetical protein